jgi:hypothetical protein
MSFISVGQIPCFREQTKPLSDNVGNKGYTFWQVQMSKCESEQLTIYRTMLRLFKM